MHCIRFGDQGASSAFRVPGLDFLLHEAHDTNACVSPPRISEYIFGLVLVMGELKNDGDAARLANGSKDDVAVITYIYEE